MTANKKSIVIDGNSLLYRAFFATQNQLEFFARNNLPPTNAIKLVTHIVYKLVIEKKYDYALVAFDHHKRTFRNDAFEEYKAGRKSMPDELRSQLPQIKENIEIMGIKTLSLEGIEADDIIGSFATLMAKNGVDVDVYTSDKDMLQLVKKNINVNLFKTGISEVARYEDTNFSDMFFGLKPEQIPDYKGIAGDPSDNLSGIKGIGKVTAVDLLKKYDSMEGIYANLEKLTKSQQAKFNDSKVHGLLCKQLAILKLDCSIEECIDAYRLKPINQEEFLLILKKYHLSNIEENYKKQLTLF